MKSEKRRRFFLRTLVLEEGHTLAEEKKASVSMSDIAGSLRMMQGVESDPVSEEWAQWEDDFLYDFNLIHQADMSAEELDQVQSIQSIADPMLLWLYLHASMHHILTNDRVRKFLVRGSIGSTIYILHSLVSQLLSVSLDPYLTNESISLSGDLTPLAQVPWFDAEDPLVLSIPSAEMLRFAAKSLTKTDTRWTDDPDMPLDTCEWIGNLVDLFDRIFLYMGSMRQNCDPQLLCDANMSETTTPFTLVYITKLFLEMLLWVSDPNVREWWEPPISLEVFDYLDLYSSWQRTMKRLTPHSVCRMSLQELQRLQTSLTEQPLAWFDDSDHRALLRLCARMMLLHFIFPELVFHQPYLQEGDMPLPDHERMENELLTQKNVIASANNSFHWTFLERMLQRAGVVLSNRVMALMQEPFKEEETEVARHVVPIYRYASALDLTRLGCTTVDIMLMFLFVRKGCEMYHCGGIWMDTEDAMPAEYENQIVFALQKWAEPDMFDFYDTTPRWRDHLLDVMSDQRLRSPWYQSYMQRIPMSVAALTRRNCVSNQRLFSEFYHTFDTVNKTVQAEASLREWLLRPKFPDLPDPPPELSQQERQSYGVELLCRYVVEHHFNASWAPMVISYREAINIFTDDPGNQRCMFLPMDTTRMLYASMMDTRSKRFHFKDYNPDEFPPFLPFHYHGAYIMQVHASCYVVVVLDTLDNVFKMLHPMRAIHEMMVDQQPSMVAPIDVDLEQAIGAHHHLLDDACAEELWPWEELFSDSSHAPDEEAPPSPGSPDPDHEHFEFVCIRRNSLLEAFAVWILVSQHYNEHIRLHVDQWIEYIAHEVPNNETS